MEWSQCHHMESSNGPVIDPWHGKKGTRSHLDYDDLTCPYRVSCFAVRFDPPNLSPNGTRNAGSQDRCQESGMERFERNFMDWGNCDNCPQSDQRMEAWLLGSGVTLSVTVYVLWHGLLGFTLIPISLTELGIVAAMLWGVTWAIVAVSQGLVKHYFIPSGPSPSSADSIDDWSQFHPQD